MKLAIPALAALALLAAAPMTMAFAAPRMVEKIDPRPAPKPNPHASAITVLVLEQDTGAPLANALVRIAAVGPVDPVWSGRTDKHGIFQLAGLDRGTYAIHAESGDLMADQMLRLPAGSTQTVVLQLGGK
jgi:hypothetical protein